MQSNTEKCTLRADGGWVNQFRGRIASKGLLLLLNSPMGNPLFYLSLKETRTSRYIQVCIRQLLQHNVIKVDQLRIASKDLVDRPTQLICIFTLQMIASKDPPVPSILPEVDNIIERYNNIRD